MYVIKLSIDGEVKYVYTGRLFVSDIDIARKFYSLTYARRYIKNHPVCFEHECVIIDAVSLEPQRMGSAAVR